MGRCRGIEPSNHPTPAASSLRKRFWQVGLGLALFLATAVALNPFLPADRAVTLSSAGHDFLAFYTAGTFLRSGRRAELYDLAAVRSHQRELAAREQLALPAADFAPYWNPPLFAGLFVPLSRLTYPAAWWMWTALNLACLAGAMAILARILRQPEIHAAGPASHAACDWRTWGLVPLLTITSMPFIQAIGHGQNTGLSLLIVSATVLFWRDDRPCAAGLAAGLLFYKPQLSAVLAAALVLSGGWRALTGLAMTGSTVLIATLVALPGTLVDFLHRLPRNVAFMQLENRYPWDRHVTLKAFWRLLVQGLEIGATAPLAQALYLATAAVLAAALLAVGWTWRRDASAQARDRRIAVTIVAMPLLMPFYFDYDLLLLAVPAVLVAREALRCGAVEPRLTAAWIALAAWLMVNPLLALRTHVNGTVVLLSLLAAMMIARALRREPASAVSAGRDVGAGDARPLRCAAA